jgi:hypothetical protein
VSKHVLTDFQRDTKQVSQGKDSQKQYQPETTETLSDDPSQPAR